MLAVSSTSSAPLSPRTTCGRPSGPSFMPFGSSNTSSSTTASPSSSDASFFVVLSSAGSSFSGFGAGSTVVSVGAFSATPTARRRTFSIRSKNLNEAQNLILKCQGEVTKRTRSNRERRSQSAPVRHRREYLKSLVLLVQVLHRALRPRSHPSERCTCAEGRQ